MPRLHVASAVLAIPLAAALGLTLVRAARADDDAIQVDRPDFTDSAFTMTPHRLQLEVGVLRTKEGHSTEDDLGQASLRYGLADGFELRVEPGSWVRQRGGGVDASGWDGGDVGFKWRLHEGKGRRPTFAIEATAGTPWGARSVGSSGWQPQVLLAVSCAPLEHWSVDTNVGWSRQLDDAGRFDAGLWSVSISRDVSDAVSVFGEYYGVSREGRGGGAVHRLDAGIGWQLGQNAQLDAWGGTAVGGPGPDWYGGGGFAVRF